jgi:group I intron endonuclease
MITYIATNTLNGKFYIGSTSQDFEWRKRKHLTNGSNYPFQNTLRNNPEAFEWEVFEDDSDERVLEQALLDMWYGTEQCYNLSRDASAPMSGRKHSKETIQHFKEARKGTLTGELNPMFGRTGGQNPFFGKKHTEETRRKMSEKTSGENAPHLGKKWWINESGNTLYQREDPGDGWKNGRVWR